MKYSTMAGGPPATYDPMRYSSMAGAGTDVMGAAPLPGDGSPWMGRAGVGLQVTGNLISGYAAISDANEQIKAAGEQLAFTERQIYDTYNQLFAELGERNRRLYAQQNVAVATSGLAVEGSIKTVLDEAVNIAKQTSQRMDKRMQSELQAARYRARQQRKQAERNKKYGRISMAINTGAALAGLG